MSLSVVVGLQRLALVVQLLHLQGHDLLVLDVRDVVGGVPLRAGGAGGSPWRRLSFL